MAKTIIDKLGWEINLIMSILLGFIWNGINRILRGKLLWGILWMITIGGFFVGWIFDVYCVIKYKQIKFLA